MWIIIINIVNSAIIYYNPCISGAFRILYRANYIIILISTFSKGGGWKDRLRGRGGGGANVPLHDLSLNMYRSFRTS